MDDHPPSWQGNGLQHLAAVVALPHNVTRTNFFLPHAHDALAKPVDGVLLARALVENFTLTSLELYRCQLDVKAISALAQALSVNKYITYVGLARNRFYTDGGIMVAEMLKVNQTIVSLDLSWNELRDPCAVSLAEALTMNNSLQRLHLDKNRISGDGGSALAQAVASNGKLRTISISQNNINAFGLGFLGKALTAHHGASALQGLDLSANAVAPEGMFSLFSSLATATRASTLVTLNLGFNKIGGSSILVLGSALMKMPAVRELNLENTLLQYTPELREFCRAVAVHPALVNLSLARNNIGDEGVDCVCEALAVAGLVKYLDLSECGITKKSLEESLLKLTKECKQLQTLHLSDNNFSEDGAGAAIAKVVAATQSVAFLGLQRCRLGAHGMDGLCTTLQFRSPSFTGLSLRGNRFGDAGFAQLLPFVLHHAHLRFLDIAQNDVTSFVHPRLCDVFQTNFELPYLVLEDDIVFTPENAKLSWEDVAHRTTAPSGATLLPPLCNAAVEMQTGLPPSAIFATYSAAVGSSMRRQVEESSNLVQGLVLHAGQPVRHCHVWDGDKTGTVPQLGAPGSFAGGPSDAIGVGKLENNIGGLLVSDDQLRREFNRLDVTGSGFLTSSDFKRVYRSMEHFGVERSEKEIDRVLRHYGGGIDQITFDIFCVVMLKLAQH
jgi:Ran GTPase-activating protein (RanGAP) involved in mRNA processing and transport